jgi:hypothetical protein
MRIGLIALAAACVACSTTSPKSAPPDSIAGMWNQSSGILGH